MHEGGLRSVVAGADLASEYGGEPIERGPVVEHRGVALVGDCLADPDVGATAADRDRDARPGFDGGDSFAATSAGEPEGVVVMHEVHDHADGVAG